MSKSFALTITVLFVLAVCLVNATSGNLQLKVDLCFDLGARVPDPNTFKGTDPGCEEWIAWPAWADDGETHDARSLFYVGGIRDLNVSLTVNYGAAFNLFLSSHDPSHGKICNTWLRNEFFGGSPSGDIHLVLWWNEGIVPGRYRVYGYHNDPLGSEVNMPMVTAMTHCQGSAYNDNQPPYDPDCYGVSEILPDVDVPVQHESSDQMLVTSVVEFYTDGSPVEILYVAGPNSSAVLNAFVIEYPDTPLTAWAPVPRDRSSVSPDVYLSWRAGQHAAYHDVYFGTDSVAVRDADTTDDPYNVYMGQQPVADVNYDPSGALQLGKTYYWRIDEVNGPNTWKGNVWTCETRFLVIDGFESYDLLLGDIYNRWVDGTVNSTGSSIGLQEFSKPLHTGKQSMWYRYDNAADHGPGYYSEAARAFDGHENWPDTGVETLTLFFHGYGGNDANSTEQMYVGLEDSSYHYAEVRYGDHGEDMNDIRVGEWYRWNMPLEHFGSAGVDLAAVEKLYVGFGLRGSGVPGGSGYVWFDDIRLYLPGCVNKPAGDLNHDCAVDFKDVALLAGNWLAKGQKLPE